MKKIRNCLIIFSLEWIIFILTMILIKNVCDIAKIVQIRNFLVVGFYMHAIAFICIFLLLARNHLKALFPSFYENYKKQIFSRNDFMWLQLLFSDKYNKDSPRELALRFKLYSKLFLLLIVLMFISFITFLNFLR